MGPAPAPSNRLFWIIIGVLGLGAVLGGAVGMWNYTRGPIVETLRAAQLAPLPRSAEQVRSESKMNGATYEVQVNFQAPEADVERWLKTSPSLRKLEPTRPDATTRLYTLPSTPNAKAVRVTVDDAHGQVEIELQRG